MSLASLRLPLAMTLLLAASGCGGGDDDSGRDLARSPEAVAGDTAVLSTVEPEQLDDGQIAAILSAADSAEIVPSEIAIEAASSQQLRDYARRMVEEHRALSVSVAAVTREAGITPRPNREASLLATQTRATVESLRAHAGAAFDSAYAAAMVQSHEMALNLIDSQLIEGASDERLRTAIETRVRPAVAMHLEQIRQIQTTLTTP